MKEGVRLKEFRDALEIKQKELALLLGIRQNTLSVMEGKSKIPDIYKERLATVYKLNRSWLETGEGYMFLDFATLQGRLRYIMNSEHHNTRDFAYTAQLSENKVIKVLEGEESFTGDEISRISKSYEVYNTNWILTGNGDVYDSRIKAKYKNIHAENSIQQVGEGNTAGNNYVRSNEIELLKEKIVGKDKEIELLKKMIDILQKK